jgi:hypothetical protein
MVTNYEDIAARPITAAADSGPARGLWARAVTQLQSAVCGLHGHDLLLQFEPGRIFLRCTSCGHESPGWATGERRPRLRFHGDARRHRITEPSPARSQSIA